jgi:PAS domain S-box-containing protein
VQLKQKIMIGATLLAVVPVIIASLAIELVATNSSYKALQKVEMERLIAVRDVTKQGIENYLGSIRDQVLTFSKDIMIVDAMSAFRHGFRNYQDQGSVADIAKRRKQLGSYYHEEFNRRFQQRNPGITTGTSDWLARLDTESVLLQYQYIRANLHPLGEKDKLSEIGGSSAYSYTHALYHPVIRDYLKKFYYYDIFLVDSETGDIVYSVFKELDYTTSLMDGSFANTGIGEVFSKANQANSPDFVALSDFSPYAPSYQDPAAFIASPIYKNEEKIGVLIFQMPINRINSIMTHDRRWNEAGLAGSSGETYLVGADSTMRSMSRMLIEDRKAYFGAIRNAGVPSDVIELMRSKDTSIGLQPVSSTGSKAALAGRTGFDIITDYRNVSVLSAYAPIKFEGLNWAIMSEIDESEAFAAADALKKEILILSAGIVGVLIILAIGVGFWFAGTISKPVHSLRNAVQHMTKGVLGEQVDDSSKDEIGDLARAFNKMNETLLKTTVSREYVNNIISNMTGALLIVTPEGKIEDVNAAALDMLGYEYDDLIGGRITDVLQKDMAHLTGKTALSNVEETCICKGGREISVLFSSSVIRDVHKEIQFIVCVAQDLTQRKREQELFHRSQKMEVINRLSGGVAHDFNNQLGIVIGHLDFLKGDLSEDQEKSQWVDTAINATQRCMDLTRQLLGFSRRQIKETAVVSINVAIKDLKNIIERSVTPEIDVQYALSGRLWATEINLGEFKDAILNLIINARDAMPASGKLLIETSNKPGHEGDTHFGFTAEPGNYVQLSISDTGMGMSNETLEHLFEPFFTTKSKSKGTGLGMAMVYGFVKRHGGSVDVISELKVGTAIHLYFPRSVKLNKFIENEPVAKSAEKKSLPGGDERILIVEDEVALLELAKEYLADCGYQILQAENASQALDVLAGDEHVDLLFSDVVMPGNINGYQLAKQAKAQRPGIKVLLTSGFVDEATIMKDEPEFEVRLLNKPYRKDDLLRRVREAIDGGKGKRL